MDRSFGAGWPNGTVTGPLFDITEGSHGMTTLILGCGFSGKAIASTFAAKGGRVIGTTRNAEKFGAIRATGAQAMLFDGTMTPELAQALKSASRLILSISPDQGGDPVLPLVTDIEAAAPGLVWAAYLSTVGVYGDHEGGWVDEDSPCKPVSSRSIARLEAEQAWASRFAEAAVPLAILRLSGIYGPGRNQIRTAMAGEARRLVKPGQVFNRIRVEDIAGAALHLADRGRGGVFNVTDDEPAPPQDVVAFACHLAGVALPPEQDFATAELTPMARSFYGENKRVANLRIKNTGYRFAHPDYRLSLTELWQSGRWRG
jgi:nucleoside-diphosphate-sugar epimerase